MTQHGFTRTPAGIAMLASAGRHMAASNPTKKVSTPMSSNPQLSAEHRALIAAVPRHVWSSLGAATRASLSKSTTADFSVLRILAGQGAPVMSIPALQAIAAQNQVLLDQLEARIAEARDPMTGPDNRPSTAVRMQMVSIAGHAVVNEPGTMTLGAPVLKVQQ